MTSTIVLGPAAWEGYQVRVCTCSFPQEAGFEKCAFPTNTISRHPSFRFLLVYEKPKRWLCILNFRKAFDEKNSANSFFAKVLEKIDKQVTNLRSIIFPYTSNAKIYGLIELFATKRPDVTVAINSKPVDDIQSYDWETTSLLDYTKNNIPKEWEDFFETQLDPNLGTLTEISNFLKKEAINHTIYPPLDLIFRTFHDLPPSSIKVIIIGQDPYINVGEAMGMSFSVPSGTKIPPSLRNIQKELQDDGFNVDGTNGDLTSWQSQGVFLINTALTVRAKESNSHASKWSLFITALFRYLNNKNNAVVIMWGQPAQSYSSLFNTTHKKITSSHPSPFSAHKSFFGSKPFSQTNKFLKSMGKKEIDWNL